MLSKSRTLAVSISRPPAEVYHFVSNPQNLPDWAEGIDKSAKVRFVESNPYGVLDHYVTIGSGPEIHVPMRVFPNGPGSEVLFTVFQPSGMSDEAFGNDVALVERDLQVLKRVLEG